MQVVREIAAWFLWQQSAGMDKKTNCGPFCCSWLHLQTRQQGASKHTVEGLLCQVRPVRHNWVTSAHTGGICMQILKGTFAWKRWIKASQMCSYCAQCVFCFCHFCNGSKNECRVSWDQCRCAKWVHFSHRYEGSSQWITHTHTQTEQARRPHRQLVWGGGIRAVAVETGSLCQSCWVWEGGRKHVVTMVTLSLLSVQTDSLSLSDDRAISSFSPSACHFVHPNKFIFDRALSATVINKFGPITSPKKQVYLQSVALWKGRKKSKQKQSQVNFSTKSRQL